jgi:hypothetical protein
MFRRASIHQAVAPVLRRELGEGSFIFVELKNGSSLAV